MCVLFFVFLLGVELGGLRGVAIVNMWKNVHMAKQPDRDQETGDPCFNPAVQCGQWRTINTSEYI